MLHLCRISIVLGPNMSKLSENDLTMAVLLLDEEEKEVKTSWMSPPSMKRETEGEFTTTYKELIDDKTV
ncbi:hypothetical protein Trydic_g555 [Trypoxylus dichotomus]